MDLEIVHTNSKNPMFIQLIELLDEDLTKRYGTLQKQYEKHNKVDFIKNVVVIVNEKVPTACGAFKDYNSDSVELKRIFVKKDQRRRGLARLLINKLEELAKEKGYQYAMLETGIMQQEAISLYINMGYAIIENYEPYINNTNSICMRKVLH